MNKYYEKSHNLMVILQWKCPTVWGGQFGFNLKKNVPFNASFDWGKNSAFEENQFLKLQRKSSNYEKKGITKIRLEY